VCHTDITARVSLLRELAGEELVELGMENTIGHELALLADLSGHRKVNCEEQQVNPRVIQESSKSHAGHPSSDAALPISKTSDLLRWATNLARFCLEDGLKGRWTSWTAKPEATLGFSMRPG
jgi:hypothetical protein